jgi:parallel beta-helix repeat protein
MRSEYPDFIEREPTNKTSAEDPVHSASRYCLLNCPRFQKREIWWGKRKKMNLKRPFIVLGMILVVGIQAHSMQAPGAPSARAGLYDVREFGAKGDGATLDTQAIQSAIRAANQAGGGTVVFLPGIYVTGTFELLSNVTLDVEAGAVILGSRKVADYGSTKDFGFGKHYGTDSTGEGFRVGLIVARNADNIAIVGSGAIDGNSDTFFDFKKPHYSLDFDPQYTRQGQLFMDAVLQTGDGPIDMLPEGRSGTMIILFHCKHVLLRDITLRNAPNWTLHLQTVEAAVVEGIHILNDLRLPNNDGVDCFACRNVQFSNCDMRTGDDDFAIVGSEDITVTNCTLTSNSSGIRLEDTRSSVFNNLTIHANRGIAIYESGEGATASVLFSDIVIDTHLLTGHWWGKGEPIYIAIGRANGQGGVVRDVRFSNISAEAENGIVLFGDPKALLQDISFDGVSLRLRVTRKEVNAAVGGNFDLRWTTDGLKTAVFAHDIPGLYARYVKGLEIHGLTMQWADGMPAYYSSALELEDAGNLMIDRFEGRQASIGSHDPVIALKRVKGVTVRNCTAAEGASTFLSTSEVTGERLFEGNDLADARRAFNAKTDFELSGNLLPAKKN